MRTANKYIINDIYIYTYTNAQIKHEIETVFAHEYDTRNLCMIYIELCVNFILFFVSHVHLCNRTKDSCCFGDRFEYFNFNNIDMPSPHFGVFICIFRIDMLLLEESRTFPNRPCSTILSNPLWT